MVAKPPPAAPSSGAVKKQKIKTPTGGEASAAPHSGAGLNQKWDIILSFFRDEKITDDLLLNDVVVYQRHRRLMGLLWVQTLTVVGLSLLVMIAFPLLRPIYIYNVLSPELKADEIVGLDSPNVTKRALLSWAATSITEILTFGFGDFDRQLARQRPRFTSDGWTGFLEALEKQGLREDFKSRQLVLTTVPSDVPVVVAEGLSKDEQYQWNVEMPVIMTFLTNNNVKKRQHGVIQLEIVRVPSKENIQGIAIQSWRLQQ